MTTGAATKTIPTDYLSSDPELPDQRYALISVVMPQSAVQQRELFYVQEFFKSVSDRFGIKPEQLAEVQDLFQTFREEFRDKVDARFAQLNKNMTSVFGLKIRAVSSNRADAECRGDHFQAVDPLHNIFLVEVGKWLPLEPDLHTLIRDQKFAEQQLNELIGGYEENKRAKDQLWADDTRERVAQARKDGTRSVTSAVAADVTPADLFVSPTELLDGQATVMPYKDV
jgi:hypothetical protein